jgi:hypothetical protein
VTPLSSGAALGGSASGCTTLAGDGSCGAAASFLGSAAAGAAGLTSGGSGSAGGCITRKSTSLVTRRSAAGSGLLDPSEANANPWASRLQLTAQTRHADEGVCLALTAFQVPDP